MRRRTITVPKSNEALVALDFDGAMRDQLIEYYLNEEEFILLFREGIFSIINEVGRINIDDYEDEVLMGKEKILSVIEALETNPVAQSEKILKLTNVLIRLLTDAYKRNTAVFFYF